MITEIPERKPSSARRNLIIGSVVFVVVVAIVLAVVLIFTLGGKSDSSSCYYCSHANQSQLGDICSPSPLGQYKQYAVSTDSNVCAPAGKTILEKGGNAVDAAISVFLCMGVTIPESLGLGGGSLIVIYHGKTKKSTFINARESAPAAAHRDMFNQTGLPTNRSSYGLESIGVPGELAGYWRMYNKYGSGKVAWQDLFAGAIDFARNGFPVGQHLNDALEQNRRTIMNHASLKSVYVNPATNDLYKKDEVFKQATLAKTLETLSKSKSPHQLFYETIAKQIISDINNLKSEFPGHSPIITEEDFRNYTVIENDAFSYKLKDNLTLHSCGLPGAGMLLSFILRTMLKYEDLYPAARHDGEKAKLFFHRLTETFKFAFANRMYLGDDNFDNVTGVVANLTSESFINQIVSRIDDKHTHPSSSGYYDPKVQYNGIDKGTAHVAVLDSEGTAVSVTATVNLYFGSKVFSTSTGIILNDEMDDFNTGAKNEFDLPVSYANTVHANKRPLSSMTPAVFTDDSGVRLVIGASGGPKILTSVAYTSLRQLWLGDNIKQAIDSCRTHDQLFPEKVVYEPCFPEDILRDMKQRQHNVSVLPQGVRGAVVMGISRSADGIIQANSDYRKGGTVAGL